MGPANRGELEAIAAGEALLGRQGWGEEELAKMFQRASTVFWVARLGTNTVGHLLMNVVEGECEILSITIRQEARRRGFGRELMRRALMLLDPCDVFLDVKESNEAAIALYEGLGFEVVGRRKRYYPSGEDALLMRLTPGVEGADN